MDMVSIIIPAYNAEKHIEKCIESILCQTEHQIEIIIVDDGSVDNTLNICNKIKSEHNNIKVISQNNAGVNAARKKGYENSSGDWIMFVDADDTLPSNSIQSLLSESHGYDIVSGRFKFIDLNDLTLDKKGPINELTEGDSYDFISKLLIGKRWKCLWRQIIRRSTISPHYFDTDKNIIIAEDFIVMLQIGLNIKRYKGIENTVYNYRWYDESTVHRYMPNISHAVKLSDAILSIFQSNNLKIFRSQLFKCLFTIYLEYTLYKDINTTNLASFLRCNLFYNRHLSTRDKILSTMLFLPSKKLRIAYKQLFS